MRQKHLDQMKKIKHLFCVQVLLVFTFLYKIQGYFMEEMQIFEVNCRLHNNANV